MVPEMELPTPKAARKADITMSRTITPATVHKTNDPSKNYTVGMRVKHKVFGEGMILSVTPMASDHLLEIAFDRVGTKKLMSGTAPLTVL